jgi:putative RecB family exonuclease
LSPSKVSSFKDCALAFRLSTIDRVPEPPSALAAKGTLVHRALQLLMWEEGVGRRTLDVALEKLARAVPEVLDGEEYAGLGLHGDERSEFVDDAVQLVRNYFDLEDPNRVRVIGTELRMSVTLGTLVLSGIIDRLELDDDGELVVTDYKTGRAPSVAYEQTRLGGVHFYAFLCEQVLGRRPARVQLLHLREPLSIWTMPSDQSVRGLRQQTMAIWAAVEQACEREDFRPRPGWRCQFCAYHEYCPAVGGDLGRLMGAAGRASGGATEGGGVEGGEAEGGTAAAVAAGGGGAGAGASRAGGGANDGCTEAARAEPEIDVAEVVGLAGA